MERQSFDVEPPHSYLQSLANTQRLPDTLLSAGTKKFDTDNKKAGHAVATYAEVSRVNIPREEETEAYSEVHATLKKGKSCEELDETF